MQKHPLWQYVVAVIIVLAVVSFLLYRLKGSAGLETMMVFSSGFLVGMLAMFIAVHVYSWK